MKRIFTLVCLLFIGLVCQSQITVTNSTFPSKGDTLKFLTDNAPQNFDMSIQGGNQTWDFSSLRKINPNTVVMKESKVCDVDLKFTDAELCQENANFNLFFNKKNTAFELIGAQGNLIDGGIGLEIPNFTRYSPAQIIRRSPMKFFDVNNTSFNQRFTFSTSAIPDSLLGGAGALVDSVRFSISSTRLDVVDAWGKCKIPDGIFDVLREKRTELRTTKIEVRTFLGWIDLSTILGGGGQDTTGIGNLIGTDTIVTYHFVNDKSKEDIAVLTMTTANEVSDVVYKRINDITATIEISNLSGNPQVQVSPNPAHLMTKLTFNNFKSGPYKLALTSISRPIDEQQQEVSIVGNHQEMDLDISKFNSELIILNIYDKENRIVAVSKIAIH